MKVIHQGAVTSIYFDGVNANWEQWVLLSSDRHHDSIHCNRKLEKKHLDMALERDALILDAGDLFDAMQGKYDPRKSYTEIRPEYLVESYYNAIVDDAVEFYSPYAKNMALLGRGNHDSSVLRNANIDLVSMLTHGLKGRGADNLAPGGYGGYVRFMYTNGKPMGSLSMKYFHGAGGESRQTRGVTEAGGVMTFSPDADILWSGHNHHNYIVGSRRERLSNKGQLYFDLCYAVRSPGYNDTHGDGTRGWSVESGHIPKPLGSIWLKFTYEDGKPRVVPSPEIE